MWSDGHNRPRMPHAGIVGTEFKWWAVGRLDTFMGNIQTKVQNLEPSVLQIRHRRMHRNDVHEHFEMIQIIFEHLPMLGVFLCGLIYD